MVFPRGAVPPIPTFLKDGQFDRASQESLLLGLRSAGLDGVLTLGTVGEGPVLSGEVRHEAIVEAVRCFGEGRVIAGCFGQTPGAVLDQIRAAADSGAAAALALPPYYFGLPQRTLLTYYQEIADAAPLPILLYHIPKLTGNPLEPELLGSLAAHPNIVGMKDSGGDLMRFLRLRQSLASDDFVVFQGVAALVGPTLIAGASDTMCTVSALLPRHERSLRQAILQGDGAAFGDPLRLIALVADLFRRLPYPIPATFKAVAHLLGLGPLETHLPALSPDESELRFLRQELDAMGVFSE